MPMENIFGAWLRNQLKIVGITQGELAQKIGVQQSQVSRIISGDRGTSIEVLEGIAIALHVPSEVVFRVAAGKSPYMPEKDEWIEQTSYKLSKLDPARRQIAENLIDALLKEEPKTVRKPRMVGSKA